MAVFKIKCANTRIKVNNVDHEPPHCHVFPGGENVVVDLVTLAVLRPPNAEISPAIRKYLRRYQVAMLAAWENVVIVEDS